MEQLSLGESQKWVSFDLTSSSYVWVRLFSFVVGKHFVESHLVDYFPLLRQSRLHSALYIFHVILSRLEPLNTDWVRWSDIGSVVVCLLRSLFSALAPRSRLSVTHSLSIYIYGEHHFVGSYTHIGAIRIFANPGPEPGRKILKLGPDGKIIGNPKQDGTGTDPPG